MSRAYRVRQRVRVQERLCRDVAAHDAITTQLEILEILPNHQMAELLRLALRERGYIEVTSPAGQLLRREQELTICVVPETGEVSIQLEATEAIAVEGSKESTIDRNPTEQDREQLRSLLREELEAKVEEAAHSMRQQVSKELEATLTPIAEELEQVVNRVTAEALKAKARQLGEIKEISEDPEAGALTIKVEI